MNTEATERPATPSAPEREGLLPVACPFCGATDIASVPFEESPDYDENYPVVAACMTCGATGPSGDCELKSAADAFAAWNLRSPTPGLEKAVEALCRADGFITNGIALGYIRMPDADTPDTAHEVPGLIRAALRSLKEGQPDG